jgi:hypothetical protein
MDILVQRQLDNMASGNGAYLETFLRMVKAAGMDARLVFAPFQSFGNRPWAEVHPRFKALVREIEWPASVRIGRRYWSVSPRVWMRFALRILKEAWRRAGGKVTIASYLGREIAPGEARRLAALCDRRPADITLAEYSSMGPALKQMQARTIHTCLMHDLLSERAARRRAGGQVIDCDETSLETELGWLSSCELIFFASASELETLRAHLPATRMTWVAPDAPDYGAPEDSPAPRVVFIGTVHAGNTDALNHFLDDIWPGIVAEEPGLELHIAGSIGRTLTPRRAGLPGVKTLGRVDRLESLGGANAIGIAPVRIATGVSIKVAEYLLLAMPCAAYPLALQGFGRVLDDIVVVADGPDGLKAEILALVRDPARRAELSAKAKAEVRNRLSHAEPIRAIHEILGLGN